MLKIEMSKLGSGYLVQLYREDEVATEVFDGDLTLDQLYQSLLLVYGRSRKS